MIADPQTARRRARLARVLAAALAPAGIIIKCPTCGVHYDPSDRDASYPHNNH